VIRKPAGLLFGETSFCHANSSRQITAKGQGHARGCN
jgi:hypothetical protein